jgi:hypothetical protein
MPVRVKVTNAYTDRTQLFEGTEEHICTQLFFAFPFLRGMDDPSLDEVLEYLDSQQAFLVDVEDSPDDRGLTKGERELAPEVARVAMDQLGVALEQERTFEAARFMSGNAEASPERLRAALYINDGNLESAALQAYGIEPNEENKKALRTIAGLLETQKSEDPGADLKKVRASASLPEGQDVAESVQRAFLDEFVFPVALGGKHSKGTLVARDEKEHHTWLLKPGSGKQSPAKGARQESASQSRREACFYRVAKLWGLYDYLPRCELLVVDGRECAVMKLLATTYQGLEKLGDKSPSFPATLLRVVTQNGTLHQLALMDAVLGNPDRHGGNVMANDEGDFKLIDHGSAFAGSDFAPAIDKNSFVPYYLRVWAPKKAFNQLTPEERVALLPRVSSAVVPGLNAWLMGLSEEMLTAELVRYGIAPEPSVNRLRHIKQEVAAGFPMDEAVNRFWSGLDVAGDGMSQSTPQPTALVS